MFFYQGFTCPVCGKPFGEEDDVVACPTCGAPHHRHCWQKTGHCHYEADHGTDRQWARDKAQQPPVTPPAPSAGGTGVACPHCGHYNPSFAEFCAHCGQSTGAEEWHSTSTPPPPTGPSAPYGEYAPFRVADPYGGVSPEEKIEENTAQDLATYVGPNAAYYLPRFRKFATEGGKCSWNWAAFLLPSAWLLYRKQYLFGILSLVMEMLLTATVSAISYGVFELQTTLSPNVLSDALLGGDRRMAAFAMVLMITTWIMVLLRVLTGLAGNWLYYRTAKARIRRLRDENGGLDAMELAAAGGISFALASVGYVMVYLASLLAQYAFL